MVYDEDRRILGGARGSCRLTPQHHRIWMRLAGSPGKMVRHEPLIMALWPDPDDEPELGAEKALMVLICQMRARMTRVQAPESIETIWGEGYILRWTRAAPLMIRRPLAPLAPQAESGPRWAVKMARVTALRRQLEDRLRRQRACDYCGRPYRGPAVYCCLAHALADA